MLEILLLPSISNLTYSNYEIVFVDDGSEDETPAFLADYAKKYKNIKIVRNRKSKGLCYARNIGIRNAKGEIIAFTDDDCLVDRNWLRELNNQFQLKKDAACVGGRCLLGMTDQVINPKPQIHGCNMAFRNDILKRYLFDTNLIYCHWHDEKELLFRMANDNLKMHYAENVIVRHFYADASYRKKIILGLPLNKIYKFAKKISPLEYYGILINCLFFKKYSGHEIGQQIFEINEFFSQRHPAEKESNGAFKKTRLYVLYVLIFQIMFNSRIARFIECRRLKIHKKCLSEKQRI